MVPLNNDLKLRTMEKKSVFGAHFNFSIFNQETRNVYKGEDSNKHCSGYCIISESWLISVN